MNTKVNFETAKLLKEKGFDKKTRDYFQSQGHSFWSAVETNYNSVDLLFSQPTFDEVKWWLYEKHGIWIIAFPELFNGTEVRFYPSVFEAGVGEDIEEYFNSPTEAYESVIEYTLKNLI